MTAMLLLAVICGALLLQLAAGVAVIVMRRRAQAAGAPPTEAPAVGAVAAAAWPGWRNFRVVRRQFEDAAKSQCSFYLQPVDGAPLPTFRPGQYLTFALQAGGEKGPDAGPARRLIRCYSLSDPPDAASYRITVKRMPPPAGRPDLPPGVSSAHLHDRVQVGDVLQAKAPAGHFFIDPDATVPAVFIAGGIGITPLMSMLSWCVAQQAEREVHLVYGVRNSSDQAFRAQLEALAGASRNFRLQVVYSAPGADDVLGRGHQHVGHIDVELLRRSLPHGRHRFYVCGPPPMMQSLVPALRAWGVAEADIHFEAFGPASVRPAGPATDEPMDAPSSPFNVRLRRSGRNLVWDGQDANLLDFAERHGVEVDSGCRSGSCGTCATRLVSGTVHHADKPDFEVPDGHCLLCVAQPQTALVLDL